jgi:hypothetical protein
LDYEDIVRFLELQPQPNTKKGIDFHAALLDEMRARVANLRALKEMEPSLSRGVYPSQELWDKKRGRSY